MKTSLHIVLIMDVDAPDFSTKTLSAPSIFKHMAIIWKEKWNNDGLLQVIYIKVRRKLRKPVIEY